MFTNGSGPDTRAFYAYTFNVTYVVIMYVIAIEYASASSR